MTTFFIGEQIEVNFGIEGLKVMDKAMKCAETIIVIDGDRRYRLAKSRVIFGDIYTELKDTHDAGLQSVLRSLTDNTNTIIVTIPEGYYYEGRTLYQWMNHEKSKVVFNEFSSAKLDHILEGMI